MAYTQAPTVSVYQTKTIPLMQQWQQRQRQSEFDSVSTNVVWDVIKNQTTGEDYYEAMKRYGYDELSSPVPPGNTLYGLYNWDSVDLLVIVDSLGIRGIAATGLLAFTTNITFADRHIGFTQFLYENGTITLIVTDGVNIYEVTSAGVATAIVDVDRPVTHLPYPVFLDGYLFLATSAGIIQNSNLNDPKLWTAGDFISSESYPDGLKAIARHGQYIAAFGGFSIQFYYDAANPTGTPLAAQTTVLQIGFVGGLATHKEELVFIGAGTNTKATIYSLAGLKATPILDSTLIRTLEKGPNFGIAGYLREGNILNINGHSMYTWADRSSVGVAAVQYTYMVDLDTGLFSKTTGFFSTASLLNNDWLAIRSAVTFYMFGTNITIFVPFQDGAADAKKMYNFDPTYGTDTALPITMMVQTKLEDFGTKRNKTCTRMLLDCDKASSIALCAINVVINDNIQTANAADVDLNKTYPVRYGMGQFRSIQVKLNYTGSLPMRFRGVEVDYIQGDY